LKAQILVLHYSQELAVTTLEEELALLFKHGGI
jgi:hypothetical protein